MSMVLRSRPVGRNGIVSHAGGGYGFPPNSLAGCAWAASSGCERVEIDVQRTADGAFVLFHDSAVELPGGKAPVSAVSAEEIEASLPGRTPLVRLDDVCSLFASRASVDVVLDLKYDRAGGSNEALIRAALAAVRRHGLEARVAFHSDSPALLVDLLKIHPGAVTGAAVGHEDRPFDEAALVAELEALKRQGIREAQFYGSAAGYAPVEAFEPLADHARRLDLVPRGVDHQRPRSADRLPGLLASLRGDRSAGRRPRGRRQCDWRMITLTVLASRPPDDAEEAEISVCSPIGFDRCRNREKRLLGLFAKKFKSVVF